jgi:hypothetical protein
MEQFKMREVSEYTLKHGDIELKLNCASRETIKIDEEGYITIVLWMPVLPFDFMRQLSIANEHDIFDQWVVTKETLVRICSCGADIGHDLQITAAKISFTHDSLWEGKQEPVSIITIRGRVRREALDTETLKEIKTKNEG